ncbi:hypothetical protein Dsin_003689 [Dipteronia sinensis]|uniref:Uncharacterized protein n=1 Tax=Dipteronia sinensis TaxID=43782 RepID=A0AAE0B865_9ROSI|nr:hypothetical protein Dsin_003689 [Dipteronia sinensis]
MTRFARPNQAISDQLQHGDQKGRFIKTQDAESHFNMESTQIGSYNRVFAMIPSENGHYPSHGATPFRYTCSCYRRTTWRCRYRHSSHNGAGDQAEKVGRIGTRTMYSQSVPKFGKGCYIPKYIKAMAVKKIVVSSLKMDPEYSHKVGFIFKRVGILYVFTFGIPLFPSVK